MTVAALPHVAFELAFDAVPDSADGWPLADPRIADTLRVFGLRVFREPSR